MQWGFMDEWYMIWWDGVCRDLGDLFIQQPEQVLSWGLKADWEPVGPRRLSKNRTSSMALPVMRFC